MSLCVRYAPKPTLAQEVLNDSFLKVFEQLTSRPPIQSFRGWLRRIIINTAIDAYRMEKKYQYAIDITQAVDVSAPDEDALSMLSTEELLNLLNQLPAQWKLIFNLHLIEGFTHEEIATLLKIPASSSRVYLTRAKQQLRTLIRQREYGTT